MSRRVERIEWEVAAAYYGLFNPFFFLFVRPVTVFRPPVFPSALPPSLKDVRVLFATQAVFYRMERFDEGFWGWVEVFRAHGLLSLVALKNIEIVETPFSAFTHSRLNHA